MDPEVSDQHLEKEAKGSGETEGRPSDFFFDISCDKCLIREKPRICGTFLYHSQTVNLMQSVISPENLAFQAPPSRPVGFKRRGLLWSHTTWLCHLPALWPSLSNSSELSPLWKGAISPYHSRLLGEFNEMARVEHLAAGLYTEHASEPASSDRRMSQLGESIGATGWASVRNLVLSVITLPSSKLVSRTQISHF